MRSLTVLFMLAAFPALAKPTTSRISYQLERVSFESVVVYDDAGPPKPGLLLVPNWLGITEANLRQAELVAARGYTVFVADVYGTKGRPKNQEEAGRFAGQLKADRQLLRARVGKALEVFLAQKNLPLDPKRVGAVGFCFGGTTVLELARSGAALAGVVSIHGNPATPSPDASKVTARVLALHGADDPFVSAEELKSFQDEMRAAHLDWQLVSYGNAVHSFTDVDANLPGKAMYNPIVAQRAYAAMDSFLSEAFASPSKTK